MTRCALAVSAAVASVLAFAEVTVPTITPTPTSSDPFAGKAATWTKRVSLGAGDDVDVSVYKDFAYGTRGDASDEGAGYPGHRNASTGRFEQWITSEDRGATPYHRHRSGQYFDVFKPSNMTADSPVLVYLHGGSWSQCYDKDGTSLDLLAMIAARGYVVVSADYILQNDVTEGGATTLREGATFAAMLRDVDTLVTYLRDFLPAMGVTPARLAVGGVSAGGHLSAAYAYDQADPDRLGLNLAHAIPVAVELDLVGPVNLGSIANGYTVEALRPTYGANAEYVYTLFANLFQGLTGTSSMEAAGQVMARYSPLAMVNADTPRTVAAYAELVDGNGVGLGSDGAVTVDNYHDLTNALAAAGVECLGKLNPGVDHGSIDAAPAAVEWIVAAMAEARTKGWYEAGTEPGTTDPETDPDFNTWVAAAGSDGRASTAANWSQGVPKAGQRILFDGRFSTEDCTWDGGVNGLTDSVASWRQCADYTGTVTICTTYEDADATFTRLSVAGDVEILGGRWSHPSNTLATATYHLDVAVGGDFNLAAGTAIDCRYRGFNAQRKYAGSVVGAHGGSSSDLASARDSVYFPKEIGSSGDANTVYPGGGAVWLTVGGAMTMNGDIDVHSAENTGGWGSLGSGAPGAVCLFAKSLTGGGVIHAEAPVVDRRGATTASGGRVAIYLTEATELGISIDQIPHYGALSGYGAGAGTVFVKTKDDVYGTLYVVNTKKAMSHTCGINYHVLTATTPIVAGETWTFDRVVLGKEGSLCVPTGTTLVLPNGFKSVRGDGRLCGILYAGGTITCGDGDAVHTLQNDWTFHANEPFVFDRDVVVKDGAAIGQLRFYNNATTRSQCKVKVRGRLTVETTGSLWAHMTSMVNSGNFESDFASRPAGTYCHGGLVGVYALDSADNTFGLANATYGSVFNPTLGGTHGVGNDGALESQGGGLLILEVTDELKLDGLCDATGGTYYEETGCAKGTGGAINITAKRLTGEGSITADGAENMVTAEESLLAKFFPRTSNATRGLATCSGGGRVAVKLTGAGETFSDHWRSHITARGRSTGIVNAQPGGEIGKYAMSSAGTVYLETKADGAKGGEIIVRNDGNADNNLTVTPIPAQTLGDAAEDFRCRAALTLSACGRVMLTEDLKRMGRLTMEAGTTIDLNGKRLVVTGARLGDQVLSPGRYTASNGAVAGYLSDSSAGAGGTLEVVGDGFAIRIR